MTKTIATPALRVGNYVMNAGGKVARIFTADKIRYSITFESGSVIHCHKSRTWVVR